MKKEEFVKILEKYKVPANVHDKWWEKLKQHHFIFWLFSAIMRK